MEKFIFTVTVLNVEEAKEDIVEHVKVTYSVSRVIDYLKTYESVICWPDIWKVSDKLYEEEDKKHKWDFKFDHLRFQIRKHKIDVDLINSHYPDPE